MNYKLVVSNEWIALRMNGCELLKLWTAPRRNTYDSKLNIPSNDSLLSLRSSSRILCHSSVCFSHFRCVVPTSLEMCAFHSFGENANKKNLLLFSFF